MASLHLTVDSVDNATINSNSNGQMSKGTTLSRIKSVFASDKNPLRNTLAGGTNYTEAEVATILRDFLQPDSKMPPKEAARSLLILIPDNASEHAEVYSFGEICVELAEQIPYHHSSQFKLTQLLHYLSISPKFLSKYPSTPLGDCYRPFQLLWESISDSFDGPQFENPNLWVNLNAFMAKLCATGIRGTSPGKGPEMLREAFESKAPEEAWERDANTLAAAQWILWHGQTLCKLLIYDHLEEGQSDKGNWRFGKAFAGPSMQPRTIERVASRLLRTSLTQVKSVKVSRNEQLV